jgi:NTE family protein
MPEAKVNPQVFTDAVQPFINVLQEKFKEEPLCVSDIRDVHGKQYVDLVQEGGGVHGIALAGYTYVLEKMGIGFMKMAGTSAGSINTLLLNAVYTEEEAATLGVGGTYYQTRSEKVLEYLANKPLTDMVDGHPMWRKLLLKMFSGTVGMGGLMKTINAIKRRAIIASLALLVLIIASLGLVLSGEENNLYAVFKWVTVLSALTLLVIIGLLIARIVFVGQLYQRSERLGINPGNDFERWIQKETLETNGIYNVKDLKEKLRREEEILRYRYDACKPTRNQRTTQPGSADVSAFQPLLKNIADPSVKIDDLFEQVENYMSAKDEATLNADTELDPIMNAFEQRLKAEDKGVTKELVIVSSDITHEIKVEFPGMHAMYWGADYSISPAKYVRASMSVPFFFKPFQIDFDPAQLRTIEKEWFHYMKVQRKMEPCALLVDGGMLSNFPINVFYNPAIPVPRKPTFGIKLEYEDDTTSGKIKSWMGFGGKLISTMRFFYDRDFILKHDMYQKTVRSIDTGKIHWLNFNLTNEEKVELFFRGALSATIFLARHKLTEAEIKALVEKGKTVAFMGRTFSIYGEEQPVFRTEDCLVKNSTFEWQRYKQERFLDRLSKTEKRQTLKENASLETKSEKLSFV